AESAYVWQGPDDFFCISCDGCQVEGPSCETEAEARDAWNTRAAPTAPLPEDGEETSWLIEENSDFSPHWITLSQEPWPLIKVQHRLGNKFELEKYQTPIARVKDAGAALRFARKQDAEAFVAMFDKFLLHPVATEHSWPAPEVAPLNMPADLTRLSPPLPASADVREAALREAIINTPETADFMAGVPLEAAHQRERWGAEPDAGKTPSDWFWLVGSLAPQAAASAVSGDQQKAMHHTISTAAALANWHAAFSGKDASMRPGIGPENGGGQ